MFNALGGIPNMVRAMAQFSVALDGYVSFHLALNKGKLGKRLKEQIALTAAAPAGALNRPGIKILRYGLVLVVGWIGLMKFTGYEAKGIEPLVTHSPFMSWMYSFLSVQTFSNLLGVVEVTIAILIGLRHWSAKAAALGSAGAVMMFLTTLSFLFSTPGWEPSLGGFPALSAFLPDTRIP